MTLLFLPVILTDNLVKTVSLAGRRTASCKECGVTTLEMHLPRHYAVHRCEVPVDEKLLGGGYFCDLCGLMFRQHSNLIKHWRTGCLEINVNNEQEYL